MDLDLTVGICGNVPARLKSWDAESLILGGENRDVLFARAPIEAQIAAKLWNSAISLILAALCGAQPTVSLSGLTLVQEI